MERPSAIAAVPADVGSRLRRLRGRRGLTLAAVAEVTGISKSTLSRLEPGQRRPSLELLLPIAKAYKVPLEELVGAPTGPTGPERPEHTPGTPRIIPAGRSTPRPAAGPPRTPPG